MSKSFADEFEAFVTSDDEYGDQEFGRFCQKHHAEILAALRQAGEPHPTADETLGGWLISQVIAASIGIPLAIVTVVFILWSFK